MSETPIEKPYLSIFTPSRTKPEDLEAIFTQREELLADAVDRVAESATTGNKHHMLFVGTRGSGKTHFVTLLVHRLGNMGSLDDRLHIAWLNEDETSTTVLELLINIYQALSRRHPENYQLSDIEAAYDGRPQPEAQQLIADTLLEKLKDKTLLIVTENFDALFKDIGDKGQKELRSFIQEHPVFCFAATAQRLSDELAKRSNPFFGFFQTEHLRTLNVAEASELLQKIARLNKQPDIASFLTTQKGIARIRALHRLSGGNHRIYLVLSQFITRNSIDALVEPFMKMLDELTPYYQERLRWLPALQRKIIEYLCSTERPVTVKTIATRLFKTHPTVSKQLQELRDKGYVLDHKKGREVLYELAEPMMRICAEIKENQSDQPIRLLVDFLRVWYNNQELDDKLTTFIPGSSAYTYLKTAIEQNSTQGNLRIRLLCESIQPDLDPATLIEDQDADLTIAFTAIELEKFERALSLTEEILDSTKDIRKRVITLAIRGIIYGETGQTSKAIEDYSTVINLDEAPVALVAEALVNRAITHAKIGHTQRAIKDFSSVTSLDGAHPEQVAKALFNRSVTYSKTRQTNKEIDDLSSVITLEGSPSKLVAEALVNRGAAYHLTKSTDKAINDFSSVIALKQAPSGQIAKALINRGIINYQNQNFEASQCDFQAATDLPDTELEQTVDCNLNLAKIAIVHRQWNQVLSSITQALSKGKETTPPYYGSFTDKLSLLFTSIIEPSQRYTRINEIAHIYTKYCAWSNLGEALINHIGSLYRSAESLPASDNLEQWVTSWEEASNGLPEAAIPMRILRTGIDFLKTGGKDQSILLNLMQEERSILKQALGLEDE